jgi:chemotaxis protein MotB
MTTKGNYNQAAAAPVVVRMRKHRSLGGTQGSNKTWMISFTDIMGLMLTFFVLIYAMSEREVVQHLNPQAAAAVDRGSFSGPPLSMGDSDTISLPRASQSRGLDLPYLEQVLRTKQEQVPGLAALNAAQDGSLVVLSIPVASIVDDDGGLRADAEPILVAMANLLSTISNQIELVVTGEGVKSGLNQARLVATSLRLHGYDRPLPLLVNRTTDGTARVLWRITPFQPHRDNP